MDGNSRKARRQKLVKACGRLMDGSLRKLRTEAQYTLVPPGMDRYVPIRAQTETLIQTDFVKLTRTTGFGNKYNGILRNRSCLFIHSSLLLRINVQGLRYQSELVYCALLKRYILDGSYGTNGINGTGWYLYNLYIFYILAQGWTGMSHLYRVVQINFCFYAKDYTQLLVAFSSKITKKRMK